MIINNVEIEFDFLDADNITQLENALKAVVDKTSSAQKEKLQLSDTIRRECEIIKTFFDEAMGEGTSEKIFGNKNNLNTCIKALTEVVEQKNSIQNELTQTMNKYSPNRAQRRAKK